MKELTTYDEHNTVQKLNIARADMLKFKNRVMDKTSQM